MEDLTNLFYTVWYKRLWAIIIYVMHSGLNSQKTGESLKNTGIF